MPGKKKSQPSERYKHAVNSKQQRPGGGNRRSSPGKSKKRPTAGQSKVANRLKGGSGSSNRKKKSSSNKGSNRSKGGTKKAKALPKRMEKKRVKKQTFFGKLKRKLCVSVDVDNIALSEDAQAHADSIGLQQGELRKLCMIFQMIDYDESGEIDASPMFPGNFQTALEEFDQNDDGLIDFDEFNILNRRYPLVLFPAFRLQDNMQKATLGEDGWAKVGRRVFKANYIAEYMKVHGGEMPQESFFKKLSNCFQPTVEVQMAIRITQQGEFADSGNKKKKRSRRKS